MCVMRERGIMFSGAMVRAILAGRKTQTRRAVKLPGAGGRGPLYRVTRKPDGRWSDSACLPFRCPYDAPILWVRETTLDDATGEPGNIHYRANATHADLADLASRGLRWTPSVLMPRSRCRLTLAVASIRVERARDITDADIAAEGVDDDALAALWRAASRKRRGELWHPMSEPAWSAMRPSDRWCSAWTLINGAASWEANPWVWVIDFRRAP